MKKAFKIERILSNTGILFHCSNTRDLKLERTTEEDLRYHLYITSDDEIKEGDWCISKLNEIIQFGKKYNQNLYKKIVATTDKSIDEYIPGNRHHALPDSPKSHSMKFIPESFIQAYIKAYNEGKPITEVDLEMEQDKLYIKPENIAQYESKPKELQHPHTSDSNNIWKIKTRPDGTCIVRQSKMYTREEVERFILQSHIARNKMINPFDEIPKWIDENL